MHCTACDYILLLHMLHMCTSYAPSCGVTWPAMIYEQPCHTLCCINFAIDNACTCSGVSSSPCLQLPLASVRKPEFWPEYHPSASQPSPALPAEGVDYPQNVFVHVQGEEVRGWHAGCIRCLLEA